MRFCEQLNEYITRLDCRGKELAEAAGLSAPSLSRYRTGERTPGRYGQSKGAAGYGRGHTV